VSAFWAGNSSISMGQAMGFDHQYSCGSREAVDRESIFMLDLHQSACLVGSAEVNQCSVDLNTTALERLSTGGRALTVEQS
jgi:hypothetical protein